MRATLNGIEWKYDLDNLDLAKAHELRALFDRVRAEQQMPLREALLTTFAPFLDSPFTMQIGLFLLHLERSFLLSRLDQVTERQPLAA